MRAYVVVRTTLVFLQAGQAQGHALIFRACGLDDLELVAGHSADVLRRVLAHERVVRARGGLLGGVVG